MIIFGWGRGTVKHYGAAIPLKCPNCNNSAYWHLYRRRTWFTLFFVPVIPYENKHLLLCEVCSKGVVLPSENVDKAIALTEQTKLYLNKEISLEEYNTLIDQSNILS